MATESDNKPNQEPNKSSKEKLPISDNANSVKKEQEKTANHTENTCNKTDLPQPFIAITFSAFLVHSLLFWRVG